MKRFRLILVAALLAVVAGTLAAYWLNPPAGMPPVSDDPTLAGLDADGRPRLKGLTYTQVKDGMRKWTLTAEGARYDDKTGMVSLVDVMVRFYPENGGEVTIRGDEGSYDQKNQLVILKGQVRGLTHDGNTLTTDWMSYSEGEQVADTNAWVTVAGKGYSVTGKGMLVVVPQSKVIFKSQVDSTFIPQGKGPPPGVTAELPDAKPSAGGQP